MRRGKNENRRYDWWRIPNNANTHTTIHLHSVGVFQTGGKDYPFDALTPTKGVDDKAFAGKGTNIIVGRL